MSIDANSYTSCTRTPKARHLGNSALSSRFAGRFRLLRTAPVFVSSRPPTLTAAQTQPTFHVNNDTGKRRIDVRAHAACVQREVRDAWPDWVNLLSRTRWIAGRARIRCKLTSFGLSVPTRENSRSKDLVGRKCGKPCRPWAETTALNYLYNRACVSKFHSRRFVSLVKC